MNTASNYIRASDHFGGATTVCTTVVEPFRRSIELRNGDDGETRCGGELASLSLSCLTYSRGMKIGAIPTPKWQSIAAEAAAAAAEGAVDRPR